MKYEMNRLGNCKNPNQGDYKKVLCICSAGLLRSPTAALVLSMPPFNFNTRCVGLVPEFALIHLDKVLLEWADEFVVMEEKMANAILTITHKPVVCLYIEDNYRYRDPELMKRIAENYSAPRSDKKNG